MERGEGEAERDVSLEWAEETGAQRARRRRYDAFTEEALSGWHSPPLPRLSVQTQTGPEEEKEEERIQGEKEGKEGESFSVCTSV